MPVASDRLPRNQLFILCSGWFIFVRGMDLIQEFITKLQMQSLFPFLTPKKAKKMNRGLDKTGNAHTSAVGRKSLMKWSRAFLQLSSRIFQTSSDNCFLFHTLSTYTAEHLFYSARQWQVILVQFFFFFDNVLMQQDVVLFKRRARDEKRLRRHIKVYLLHQVSQNSKQRKYLI